MPVRIYHNPRCNTSRKTLALLRDKGVEPEIVEYLKTPYTAAQLKTLLGQLKMPAKAIVRKKEAAEAGIDPPKLSEDRLIAAMAKHPISSSGRSSSPATRRRSAARRRRCWRCCKRVRKLRGDCFVAPLLAMTIFAVIASEAISWGVGLVIRRHGRAASRPRRAISP